MKEKQCLHLRPISSSRHGLRHSVYNACAKNNIITLVQYSLVIFFEVLGTFSNLSGSNMLWYINVLYHIYNINFTWKLYRINILIVVQHDIWFSRFTRQMFIFIYELHHDGNNLNEVRTNAERNLGKNIYFFDARSDW